MNNHYAISLFSGAGGLDLGVEAAGFTTKLCTDIDAFSCRTLENNKKTNPKSFLKEAKIVQGDIKQYPTDEILKDARIQRNEVDLVYGGPPCQAFSVFGKRLGLEDTRGTLVYDYIRVVREIQPKRVTFHPDYSYANFVGTYKPVMATTGKKADDSETEYVVSILNDKEKSAQEKYDILFEKFRNDGLTRLPILLGIYSDEVFKTRKNDGSEAANDNSVERNHGRAIRKYVAPLSENDMAGNIAYEYVPGPFMRVYVNALKSARSDNPKPHLLIIEEINRANVAAVFGDIFQLLDRDDDNISEYPIQASEDIKKYLAKELGGRPDDYDTIRIPDNMFIWATMNSADQGVFPMDTAFKRRWDFKYLEIDENDLKIRDKYVYLAEGKSQKVEWNKLRKAINRFLAKEKVNEDKQLGPYFIPRKIVVPTEGDEINRDEFIRVFKNKVIMYLFEDAAKQKRAKLFEGCYYDRALDLDPYNKEARRMVDRITVPQSENLLIRRDKAFHGRKAGVVIYIDGNDIGIVYNGQSAKFFIPFGEHVISFSEVDQRPIPFYLPSALQYASFRILAGGFGWEVRGGVYDRDEF